MNCFIVTKADPRRFRVASVIRKHGWTPTYCCDTNAQRKRLQSLLREQGMPRSRISLSNVPPDAGIQGVSLARDFVCRELMPKKEWSVWIDDNVEKITGLLPHLSRPKIDLKNGRNWRKEFGRELTRQQLSRHIDSTIKRAEALGTIFCGFAAETNFFFRGNKWQDFGYCRTQFALYKNDGSTWSPFNTMMLEDLYKSIDVVCRYGQVVINRHVKPLKPMFEQGGIGSFGRRLPWLQNNCWCLMQMYPGLLKYQGGSKQYGLQASEFHVAFAKRSRNTIDEWRRQHGYL